MPFIIVIDFKAFKVGLCSFDTVKGAVDRETLSPDELARVRPSKVVRFSLHVFEGARRRREHGTAQ